MKLLVREERRRGSWGGAQSAKKIDSFTARPVDAGLRWIQPTAFVAKLRQTAREHFFKVWTRKVTHAGERRT